jgi:PAS domain S-box-containing protein
MNPLHRWLGDWLPEPATRASPWSGEEAPIRENNPEFQRTLQVVLHTGLWWGGLAGIGAVVCHLVVSLFIEPGGTGDWGLATPDHRFSLLTYVALALLNGGLALLAWSRCSLRAGRLGAAGVAVSASALVIFDGIGSGVDVTQDVVLIYLFILMVVPFRPVQAFALGVVTSAVPPLLTMGTRLAQTGGTEIPPEHVTAHLAVATVLGAGASAVLHTTRRRQYREHLTTQNALRESSRRTETLIRNFPDGGVFLFDDDLRYVVAGGRGMEAVGLREEDFLGHRPRDIFPDAIAEETEERYREALEGKAATYEQTFDGRDYRVRTLPVRDAEGRVTAGMAVSQNVTERKRTRQALREEHDLMTQVFQASPAAIVVLDADGRFVKASARTEEVLGIGPEDLKGRPLNGPASVLRAADGTPYFDADRPFKEVRRENRSVHDVEHTVEGPRGRRVLSASGAPLSEGGRRTGAVFVIQDVTERREAERILREAKEEAESAARLKTAMLANMSHEVRTPLTNIIGFADLLEQESSGRAERFAGLIRQGGERLMTTLDSVLQLSKLEAGRRAVEAERVDLRAVVRQIVAENREEAQAKGVALRLEAPSGPPGAAAVRGDRGALQSIASNLIDNALKFTGEGGQVAVGLRRAPGGAEAPPDEDSPDEDSPDEDSPDEDVPEEDVPEEDPLEEAVVLTVADTGVGMSAEFQARMFEAFRQESDARAGQFEREHEGSGLGLAIVEKLVALHGGTIAVESAPGEGTTIRVRLPAAD